MQPSIMTTWVCLLALMLTSQPCHGDSVLTFTATPKAIKQNLTRHVTLRCEAAVNQARSGSTDEDIERVASYWVTYGDDEYVASVDTNEKAKGFTDEGILRVSGSVSGMGFLELTWVSPSTMRLGTYKCHVNAKSKTNRFVQLKKSLQLTSEEPSMVDLLERINQNEQDSTEKLADTEAKYLGLQEILRCMSKKVAFKAETSHSRYNGNNLPLPFDQTVVWDRVILNQGGGYNSATGEFNAPAPGLYVFHVHVQGPPSKQICLQLEKNGEELVNLFKHISAEYDDATLSHYIELVRGDVVRVRDDACRSTLYQQPDHNSISRTNYYMGSLKSASGCLA